MAVTKEDLAVLLSEKSGETIVKCHSMIDDLTDVITDVLSISKENIVLRDFGTFRVAHRKAKMGHDFQTGKSIEINARNVVAFKAGKELNKRVNS